MPRQTPKKTTVCHAKTNTKSNHSVSFQTKHQRKPMPGQIPNKLVVCHLQTNTKGRVSCSADRLGIQVAMCTPEELFLGRCMYVCMVTVRLSSSGMVVMCPVLAMYEATICLLVLLDRFNFGGGVSPGKSQTDDWAFVSGSN